MSQNLTIQFALTFQQFVNPVVLNLIGWKYVRLLFYYNTDFVDVDILPQYLVYCGWLVVEVAFVFRYIVETRGERTICARDLV